MRIQVRVVLCVRLPECYTDPLQVLSLAKSLTTTTTSKESPGILSTNT